MRYFNHIFFQIEKATGSIKTRKVLDLRQFCKVYRDVLRQVRCTKSLKDDEEWEEVNEQGEVSVFNIIRL